MPRLTPEQREIAAARYIAGESSTAIGASLDASSTAICGLLRRRGIVRRSQSAAQAKRTIRHDAFDTPTCEGEYWCGFFAADGTIVSRSDGSPEIALHIAVRDEEHVRAFRTFLGSNHAIIHTVGGRGASAYAGSTGGVRFAARSGRLVARLTELGVKRGPLAPALAASRDFWRGAVDGDGYIGISGGIAQFKLVGQPWLIEDFCRYATGLGLRITPRPHKSIYVAGTSGRGADVLTRHLYEGATVGLARKVNAAINIAAGRAVTARGGSPLGGPVNREPLGSAA